MRPEWTPGASSPRSTSIRTTADPPPGSVPAAGLALTHPGIPSYVQATVSSPVLRSLTDASAATAPSETALVDTVRENPGGGGFWPGGEGSGEPGSTGEDAPEQATARTIAERMIALAVEGIDDSMSFSSRRATKRDRATSVPVMHAPWKGTGIAVERNRASAIVDARFREHETGARFPSRFATLDGAGGGG